MRPAAEAEPAFRELTGSTSGYEVAIEIHDVDDYRANCVAGAGSKVRLRCNTRQATFTEVRLKHFVLHEVLGHGLQCATYADHAATTDVDWVRLSSVNLPYQVLLEGLAQAILLFVAPDDAPLITRVRIEHHQQFVRRAAADDQRRNIRRLRRPRPPTDSPGGRRTTSPSSQTRSSGRTCGHIRPASTGSPPSPTPQTRRPTSGYCRERSSARSSDRPDYTVAARAGIGGMICRRKEPVFGLDRSSAQTWG